MQGQSHCSARVQRPKTREAHGVTPGPGCKPGAWDTGESRGLEQRCSAKAHGQAERVSLLWKRVRTHRHHLSLCLGSVDRTAPTHTEGRSRPLSPTHLCQSPLETLCPSTWSNQSCSSNAKPPTAPDPQEGDPGACGSMEEAGEGGRLTSFPGLSQPSPKSTFPTFQGSCLSVPSWKNPRTYWRKPAKLQED